MTSGGECKWRVTLPPTKANLTAYTITATSQKHGSIKISDVLFGDVYICSGQSNMVFPLSHVKLHTDECVVERFLIMINFMLQVYNATDEVANAANYPMIRLFTTQQLVSVKPLDEPLGITEPWTAASPG